jgi:hypothetical protein
MFCYSFSQGKVEEKKRTMTYLDVIQMRSHVAGRPDISPDGKWFIYTLLVPDWEKNTNLSIILGDKMS